MSGRFLIADLHLGHQSAIKFRPQFESLEAMHDCIRTNWNKAVGKKDIVYVLGDVTGNDNPASRESLGLLDTFNGRKRLVLGNHDTFDTQTYLKYFERIEHYTKIGEGYVLSHVPVHPDCLTRWSYNIHGHLHDNPLTDPRYICVSCEQVDYTPINFEQIKKKVSS